MGNSTDGSVTDISLQNALDFGNGLQNFQTINPATFHDSEIFTYLAPGNVKSITASNINRANNGDITVIIEDGEVSDTAGSVYLLTRDDNNFWILLFSGQTLPADSSANTADITLSVEGYISYLKTLINLLEKVTYYLRLTSRLHKDSVQDAVDIVQTKRLDFDEIKHDGIDIIGIVSTVIVFAIFETGFLSVFFQEVAEAAQKLSSKPLIQKALNVLFTVIGKNSDNSKLLPEIRELEKEISRLQADSRTLQDKGLNILADAAKKPSQAEFLTRSDIGKIIFSKSISKNAAKQAAQDQKNLLENRAKDEFIKLGKEEVNRLIELGKNNAVQNISSAKDLTKQTITGFLKKNTSPGQPVLTEKTNPIPMDVYLKSYIQNLYDEPLMIFEKMILLASDLLNNAEIGGITSDESAKAHFNILSLLPSPADLSVLADDYEDTFDDEFSYPFAKDVHTKEYEFMIWTLLLGKRTKDTLIVFDETALAVGAVRQALDMTGGNQIVAIDISDEMFDYLSGRFNIYGNNMAQIFRNNFLKMNTVKEEINTRLNDTGDSIYKGYIFVNDKEISEIINKK